MKRVLLSFTICRLASIRIKGSLVWADFKRKTRTTNIWWKHDVQAAKGMATFRFVCNLHILGIAKEGQHVSFLVSVSFARVEIGGGGNFLPA